MPLLAYGCLLAILFGCATPTTRSVTVSDSAIKEEADRQKDFAVQSIVEEQKRLARVYQRLSTKAHRLCGGDLAPSTGAVYRSKTSGELASAYERLYGITERPSVLFVLDQSPASAAGLHARDVITHLNDTPVPSMVKFAEVYNNLRPEDPIRMQILRKGAPLAFVIRPEKACRYPVVLTRDLAPNAYADGTRIALTRGMMAFAKDDFELSLVLAHELAHNAMHHMQAKKQNMVGEFFAQLVAAMGTEVLGWSNDGKSSYSQEFEAEADYVGAYILAAAGLPFDGGSEFWRRMAALYPSNIDSTYAGSHSSIAYRLLAQRATALEIKDKIEHAQPLEPNLKYGQAALSRR